MYVMHIYTLCSKYLQTFTKFKQSCAYKKNGTSGSKALYPTQHFAWGIIKDVLSFLSKEKCIATHAENRLCEHKAILKRKILRIETLRTALQTLLVTITNIQ